MAMVKIYKGDKSMTVARSAYEEIFKMDGWKLKKESKKSEFKDKKDGTALPSMDSHTEDEDEDDDETEDEDDEEEFSYLHEKPVAEMTGDEVKVYAKMLDIDISGKSKAEVVKLIEKKRKK